MKVLFYIFGLSILLQACSKEALQDEAPSLIGNWRHYSAADAWEIIYIDQAGEGKIEWYTNSKLHKDTKVKQWYIEDNTLYLGKVTFSLQPYEVTAYPQVAGQETIINFDTLVAGNRYISLDDNVYVDME